MIENVLKKDAETTVPMYLWYKYDVIYCIHKKWLYYVADIDDCAVLNGGCAQICVNVIGSYVCQCNSGYVLDTDAASCDGNVIGLK